MFQMIHMIKTYHFTFGVSNKQTRPPPSSMKLPQFIGSVLIQLLFWGDDLRENVDHDHGMMSLKGQRREARHERKRSGWWRCPQEIEKSLTICFLDFLERKIA